ncbi:MAG: mechanosensitive ion channel [Lentisphaeria bacterium]|nr:mechanosensitive ion channel [Lentisphaeria bacterium]
MQPITNFFSAMTARIGGYLPTLLGAMVVVLLGLVVAGLLAKLFGALLRRMRLNERVAGKSGREVKIEGTISRTFYYLIVLYVLLLTLEILGVSHVLDPIKAMFMDLLTAVPNIIAAVLIGVIGYIVAKLISEPVGVLTGPLDKYVAKVGLGEGFRVSRILRQIVFIVIFIPLLLAALGKLKLDAISVPATEMLTSLADSVPMILAAIVILLVAFLVGRFVAGFLRELLKNLGLDQLPERLGWDAVLGSKVALSRIIGHLVLFFIMAGAAISAAEKLELTRISALLSQLLEFSANVLLGLVILAVGAWIAGLVHRVLGQSGSGRFVASMVRVCIIVLVVAMGLRAMGIADRIVDLAFLLTLGAVAVAIALSFGLGGREAAGRQMEHWFSKIREKE